VNKYKQLREIFFDNIYRIFNHTNGISVANFQVLDRSQTHTPV